MRKYTIIVEFDAEANAFSVTVPALPGCTSQGDTLEEAIANGREAIAGHIETLKQIGAPIPEETERPQAITVDVTA